MLPADQSFKTNQPAGLQSYDRLIVYEELAPIDGPSKISFELQQVHGASMHPTVEYHVPGFSERLRLVHRRVGVAQKILRELVVWIRQRDANTNRREGLISAKAEWL